MCFLPGQGLLNCGQGFQEVLKLTCVSCVYVCVCMFLYKYTQTLVKEVFGAID